MDNLDTMPEKEKRETGLNEITEQQDVETAKTEEIALTETKAKNEALEDNSFVLENEGFDEDEDLPTLYSERVIYTFSVFFSVLAGGILLARNLKEVNRKDGIPHVIAFSLIYTFLSGYLMNVSKSGLVGTVVLAIIGSMVLNQYFWNAYIGRGVNYYRKSYGKALIIALLILIPLFFFAVWGGMQAVQPPADGMRID